MQKIVEFAGITAIILFVAGTAAGCSAIGYFVGGAIDGDTNHSVDSLSVTRTVDSAGVVHSSWDGTQLASLVKEASPREASTVTMITRDGSYTGSVLTVDTALGIVVEPPDTGVGGFLRNEMVNLIVQGRSLTQVKGRVLGRTGNTVLVWVDRVERRRLPLGANASFRSEKGVHREGDAEFQGISGRLVRVPGLVVGVESLPHFFPYGDVERIRVVHSSGWGTARTIGLVTGAVFDVAAIIGLISAASALMPMGQTMKL